MDRKFIIIFVVLFFIMSGLAIAGKPLKTLTDLEKLGRSLYNDKNLSINFNQSCKTCHHGKTGFVDPSNSKNPTKNFTSLGSDGFSLGGRNAPSSAYSGFSPILHWNIDDELFIGGTFWDGRASGLPEGPTATGTLGIGPTGDPIADQAKGPFLNPIEMALDSETTVVAEVVISDYYDQYLAVYPDVNLNNEGQVDQAYNNIAMAIAAFERSEMLEKFSSRFDAFVDELNILGFDPDQFGINDENDGFRHFVEPATWLTDNLLVKTVNDFSLSPNELKGLALFNADSYQQLGIKLPDVQGARNGGMCYACHLTENHDAGQYGELNKAIPADTYNALFTDFSYDNLGVPINQTLDTYLAAIDPTRKGHVYDYGLGEHVAMLAAAKEVLVENIVTIELPLNDWSEDTVKVKVATDDAGKVKVPTLRNIELTAPYAHNGFFSNLKHIVRFYNERDSLLDCVGTPGEIDGFNCYSGPEVDGKENSTDEGTVNFSELGNLGLSGADEDLIVDFMKTLTDE